MTLPFSFLINIGNGIKAKNALSIGNPPFNYAEYTTLEGFCLQTSINIDRAKERLKRNGILVNSLKDTLKVISAKNNIVLKDIFAIIKEKTTNVELPSKLPIGIAHKTLRELANKYNRD